MRLDLAIVERGLCDSRTEAQECIDQGFVTVDGGLVTKKTRQVLQSSVIEVHKRRTYVGRGGDKLEGAFLAIYGSKEEACKKVAGKTCLDIGSSTGGFTDCLIKHGAKHVTAVDVGTSQLHDSLRNNPGVLVCENTDIRNFVTEESFDIIVCDLSFISLARVLDTTLSFGASGTEFFILIKPQFEVGYGNTKKGIVKEESLVDDVLVGYRNILEQKYKINPTILPCVIEGGDGNQEYFMYFKML